VLRLQARILAAQHDGGGGRIELRVGAAALAESLRSRELGAQPLGDLESPVREPLRVRCDGAHERGRGRRATPLVLARLVAREHQARRGEQQRARCGSGERSPETGLSPRMIHRILLGSGSRSPRRIARAFRRGYRM
jgi:hypothetical protein